MNNDDWDFFIDIEDSDEKGDNLLVDSEKANKKGYKIESYEDKIIYKKIVGLKSYFKHAAISCQFNVIFSVFNCIFLAKEFFQKNQLLQ